MTETIKVLLDLYGKVKDLFYPVGIVTYSKPVLVSLWRDTPKGRIPSLFQRFPLCPTRAKREGLTLHRQLTKYISIQIFIFMF